VAGHVSAAARSAARSDAARAAGSYPAWIRSVREFFSRGSAIWGASLTAAVLILVAIGPLFAGYPPIDFVGAPFESPSLDLPLGADIMGRDVLSRVLSGGTVILSLSALATVLGVALGGLLGISAGYFKGVADDLIMRTLDVLLAFPQTILALPIEDQLAAVPELTKEYKRKHNGAVPFFGTLRGFKLVRLVAYDQFDQDGVFVKHVERPFRTGYVEVCLR